MVGTKVAARRRRGYVREVAPGRWESVVTVRDASGKHRKVSRTVHGKKRDAEHRLSQLLVEVGEGTIAPTTQSHDTMATLVERFLEAKRLEGCSPNTLTAYGTAGKHLTRALGSTRVTAVTTASLEKLYGQLVAGGLAGSSVRKVHQVARGSLDLALRYELVRTNVAVRARAPKVTRVDRDPPSPAQVKELISAAETDNPILATMLRLGAATGARRSELLALRWTDIDFKHSKMRIRRSLVLDGKALLERPTKTGKSRSVSLDDASIEALTELRERYEKTLAEIGEGDLPANAFLFSPQPNGDRPYRPDSCTWWFSRLSNRVGVDTDLYGATRHFCASELVASGMDLRTIADRLGHDVKVLLTRYAHRRPGRDEAAAETMRAILS